MIKYKIIQVDCDVLLFFITHQDSRCCDFYRGNDYFHASNGVSLCSFSFPDICEDSDELFVRGSDTDMDDRQFHVSANYIYKVIKTIEEYNNEVGEIIL
jgi:hypothetical protein